MGDRKMDDFRRLRTSGDLIAFLSSLAATSAEDARASLAALAAAHPRGEIDSLVETLDTYVERVLSAQPPLTKAGLEAWLIAIETLELARRAALELVQLDAAWAEGVGPKLRRALDLRIPHLATLPFPFEVAGWAADAQRRLGSNEIVPWSLIPSAVERGKLDEPAIDRRPIIAAWADDQLSPVDARALQERVAREGEWRAAYRRHLRAHALASPVIGSIAGEPVRVTPLPHLGAGQAITAVAEPGRVRIIWPGRDPIELTASEQEVTVPGDEVSGPLHIAIAPRKAEPMEHEWQLVRASLALAAGAPEPPDTSRLLQVVDAFSRDEWRRELERAGEIFQVGDDPEEDLLERVRHALIIRLALETAARQLDDPRVYDALDALDDRFSDCGRALLVLSEETYRDIVAERSPDPLRWWGAREKLDRALPALVVENVLEDIRADRRPVAPRVLPPQPKQPANVVHGASGGVRAAGAAMRRLSESTIEGVPNAFRDAFLAVDQLPSPWLREEIVTAIDRLEAERVTRPELTSHAEVLRQAASIAPGQVPLLLYVPARDQCVLAELRIELPENHYGSAVFENGFRPQAWAAIRDAFHAVARLTRTRLPKALLEHHRVRFRLPSFLDEDTQIDGRSIALPAALAFGSLWLNRAIPSDLAASGSIRFDAKGGQVVCVDCIGGKAEALRAAAGKLQVRLLVEPENAGELSSESSITVVSAPAGTATLSIQDALAIAGLDLSACDARPHQFSGADRERELERLCQVVLLQQLDEFRGSGLDPWLSIADLMSFHITELESLEPLPFDITRAAALCALAYEHAGELLAAEAILRRHPPNEDTPLEGHVLYLTIALGRAIDDAEKRAAEGSPDWSECRQLDEALQKQASKLTGFHRNNLLGRSLGARGRAWMHQRELDPAIELLGEAVREHELRFPREVGRSRLYLAWALRMAGLKHEASVELARGLQEINTHTRDYSRTYADECLMYWRLESARLAVEHSRYDDAIRLTQEALAEADWRGPWPKLAILRTRALAFAGADRAADAEACIAKMRELRENPRFQWIADLLIREAEGKGPTNTY